MYPAGHPVQTHVVVNQPPTFSCLHPSLLSSNVCLVNCLQAFMVGSSDVHETERGSSVLEFAPRVVAFANACAHPSAAADASAANHPSACPTFAPFDRYGHRVDAVTFCDGYHRTMARAISHRVPSLAWVSKSEASAAGQQCSSHIERAALSYLHYQLECGTGCPLTMTYAGIAVLRCVTTPSPQWLPVAPFSRWVSKLCSDVYDPRNAHVAAKDGATIGMSMTEKQGGSDVRANSTVAVRLDPNCSSDLAMLPKLIGPIGLLVESVPDALPSGVSPTSSNGFSQDRTAGMVSPAALEGVNLYRTVVAGLLGHSGIPCASEPSNTRGGGKEDDCGVFVLTGHKWFTSAPMSDAFLVLAYVAKDNDVPERPSNQVGPSCFLVPRWVMPRYRNHGLRFQRLKNKLGDRSNASSEVEYDRALGILVGPVGHGVRTIIEMVNHTRLDCLLGSAALMHITTQHAAHHAAHRCAFGGRLIEKPLMQAVLCDLVLESEGATALAFRVASSFDRSSVPTGMDTETFQGGASSTLVQLPVWSGSESDREDAFKRLVTAVGKYYVCKRAPAVAYEALECHGGNGFVEDFPMAGWYRQAPLNAVWEGSGNVIVLDVFRALQREPGAVAAVAEEVRRCDEPLLTEAFASWYKGLRAAQDSDAEFAGRRIVEHLALILEGCALKAVKVPSFVLDAFLASRFGMNRSPRAHNDGVPVRMTQFGALPRECVDMRIIERVLPVGVSGGVTGPPSIPLSRL
eukprot:TRINITY_DN12677_c0_g1_i1.p1 TRINITY_DN12677_c0_g1~~TRINITY_DN12677_c0_g1_i1.p1  ORF type:complete len:764 (-),score=16.47 TRINITY_DN12677_c0_g1_i1:1150-3381(-)